MSHLGTHTIIGLFPVCRKPVEGWCSTELQLEIVSQRVLGDFPKRTKHEVVAELRCVNVCGEQRAAGPALRVMPEPGATSLLFAGVLMLAVLARWRRQRRG